MTQDNTTGQLDALLTKLGVSEQPIGNMYRDLVALYVERMLEALPPDPEDRSDLAVRARLEGYVAGLRGEGLPT